MKKFKVSLEWISLLYDTPKSKELGIFEAKNLHSAEQQGRKKAKDLNLDLHEGVEVYAQEV